MALPTINSEDQNIKDVLQDNNTILGDILGRLDEQVSVAKNLAEQERLRIENEEYANVEAESEARSFGGGAGLIGGGAITGAYAGAKQGLSDMKGLFPFQGMGALIGGGILATLIYSFRDSITDFIQNEASTVLEELGVGEDLTDKVREFLKNAAGVGVGASIGRIFGFRGALLGGLLGYIVQDYGLGRLFDDDDTNDQAVLDDFFTKLKEDPSQVGIQLGGLLALMGKWKTGLLIGLGSYLYKNALSKIVTPEGRQEIMDGIKSEFDKVADVDLGISDAIGVLTGAFLSTKLMSGIKSGIGSIFTRRSAVTTPAVNQAEIDQRLSTRTNQIRSQAAQEVLQSVDDADLRSAGLVKTSGGGVQRISGGYATADQLSGAVDRFGLNEQFRAAQLNKIPAPPPSASRRAINVIGKLTKYSSWFLAAGINIYAIYSIWADDQMSDSEKIRQTSYYLAGLGTGALGALAGSIAGGAAGTAVVPVVGTAIGGFIGMTIGGAAGFFAGETLVKYIVEWITGDSDSGARLELPVPEATTQQEAEALVLETAVNNMINPLGAQDSFMGFEAQQINALTGEAASLQNELDSLPAGNRRERTRLNSRLTNIKSQLQGLGVDYSSTGEMTRLTPAVASNEVSTLSSMVAQGSTMIAHGGTTINQIDNSTNTNVSGGSGSTGSPAARNYDLDQSVMGLRQASFMNGYA